MRITVLTVGTNGDVEPMIALATGLVEQGVDIRMATHMNYRAMCIERGMSFYPMPGDTRAFYETDEGRAFREPGRGIRSIAGFYGKALPYFTAQLARAITYCIDSSDKVILDYSMAWAAPFAHQRRVAAAVASIFPSLPTRTLPPLWQPGWSRFGPMGQRFGHWAVDALNRMGSGPMVQIMGAEAERLGLPIQSSRQSLRRLRALPTVVGVSPAVIPQPPDWPQQARVVGYWRLPADESWQPPQNVTDFLDQGDRPIAVGFSSVVAPDPRALARTVVDAARRAGQRVLLLSGWGAFDPDSVRGDDVLVVDRLPHDWLLPRVRAFVHHGGVGSSAAAYRAGVPQVVVPFCLDQPFWGYRAVALGVAPASIPIQDLKVESLARAIGSAVEDPRYRARAQELAGSIAADDGVRAGADFLIDHLLGSRAAA